MRGRGGGDEEEKEKKTATTTTNKQCSIIPICFNVFALRHVHFATTKMPHVFYFCLHKQITDLTSL